ncbi:MAG: DUF3038 domain-containing protein [cyanobacterium endosymbiont of Rhopalodia musculus]|uniref:DUF3038 domain-containing protein n=1 Tax=cyanobacterium endosymbiont of Epithemia clementina EcSB TaxID=3034674 RepID=UPI00247FB359|nr:DUF3038 domain-containing protein [cyanobacterium endosymbiont of Epithemia clementina EcSB]WGT68362.1 DUF3038 domain-containing protein [cyanobacterium endosymbiont of Epithemia clementina EcSB]
MSSTIEMSISVTSWAEFPLANVPTSEELERINIHLDLILLGLEALTNLNGDSLIGVATELNLQTTMIQNWLPWVQRQSLTSYENQKSKLLKVEEARSLIVIICYLCQQNQEIIRRAVTLLEQITAQNKDPLGLALLSNYFNKFARLYHSNVSENKRLESSQLSKLAFKLLVDSLFYSTTNGHHRLWLVMLDYTR